VQKLKLKITYYCHFTKVPLKKRFPPLFTLQVKLLHNHNASTPDVGGSLLLSYLYFDCCEDIYILQIT
jgi:hypothetical protein